MIGWLELIGRMVTFVVEKLMGKTIDLTMDDRRKAARRFLGLYYALSDLEVLTREVLVELRAIVDQDDPSMSREWLRNVAYAVEGRSVRFLDASQGLREVLTIFDPVLAQTVSDLEASKFSFLVLAANGFELVCDANDIREIRYTHPRRGLHGLSLTEHYNWYKERYPLDRQRSVDWPRQVLRDLVAEDAVQKDRLVVRDPSSVQRFAELLQGHLEVLASARESLAGFLREHFTLDNLLAVQRPISQFDRVHVMHRMSDAVALTHDDHRTPSIRERTDDEGPKN